MIPQDTSNARLRALGVLCVLCGKFYFIVLCLADFGQPFQIFEPKML